MSETAGVSQISNDLGIVSIWLEILQFKTTDEMRATLIRAARDESRRKFSYDFLQAAEIYLAQISD